MFEQLIDKIRNDKANWKKIQHFFIIKEIPARTTLLHEGEISTKAFFIREGCLRQWFNKDGKDITFQFFFEGQPVASLDSFINNQPSLFSIESIEPSVIITMNKDNLEKLYQIYPEI